MLAEFRSVLEKLPKSFSTLAIQSVHHAAPLTLVRHQPAQLHKMIKRASNRSLIHIDFHIVEPPLLYTVNRIFRVGVGIEISENQPCHCIVVLYERRPVHRGRKSAISIPEILHVEQRVL